MQHWTGLSRRHVVVAALSILIGAASISIASAQEETDSFRARWVATWSAPPMAHGSAIGESRSFENQTVRQIVNISAGGSRIRVTLSNEYGEAPLIIGSVHVALQSSGASILPRSDRTVTFRGHTSVVIPQGAATLSDPVDLSVSSNTRLTISIYVPQSTGFATYHQNGNQTVYVSTAGDFSGASDFPVQDDTSTSRYWLAFVEVLPPKRIGALAIFGDSISEGSLSTLNANRRVNDVLSRRFNPPGRPARLAVVNQSTGCGRLLRNFCGPSGLSRFERDVLNASGVTQVVLELGLGDIIFPTAAGIPSEIVTVEELMVGIRQLIRQARSRGLRVIGTTITPNEGTTFGNVHTPENEAKRLAFNHWVRTSGEFHAVADYDLALRDPDHPARLLALYAAADKIHLNDAGNEALAREIARSLH